MQPRRSVGSCNRPLRATPPLPCAGALTTAGFNVLSADISNHNGMVNDVFKVQTEDDNKKVG